MVTPPLQDLPAPPPDKTGWPWTEQSDPLPEAQPDGSPWPRISIITPSYNQGQFIEQTIRSILLQGYSNLEYIVMDGGSTDQTMSVLEKYDPWITHWESKSDGGQADAINQGVERSTGDLFNWINSDDYLHPGALRAIADGFATGADVVAGPVINFDGTTTERVVNRGLEPRFMLASSRYSKFHQPGVWLRRPLLGTVLPFKSDLRYCFDTELYVRYLNRYPVVEYVETPLVHFRLHDASKTVSERSGLDREFYHLKRRLMDDGYAAAREVYHQRLDEKTWHRAVNLVVEADRSRGRRAGMLLALALQKDYAQCDRFFLSSLLRRVLFER